VDGLPANVIPCTVKAMQTFTVIPETIENISYGMGSYRQSVGNFATAGHVDFRTWYVRESVIKVQK
jgi:hypothetical protein